MRWFSNKQSIDLFSSLESESPVNESLFHFPSPVQPTLVVRYHHESERNKTCVPKAGQRSMINRGIVVDWAYFTNASKMTSEAVA